ncbi:activating signal cointegrator 1-like [Watersipora subatra]|uniref:activating signal cointegrator 1-like n=1 Tax=Watersipora subatra TaxID=2589382 RepID=UPI00355C8EDD
MSQSSLATWVGVRLSKLLGFDASGDFTSYLLSMESKADLEDYLQELLNTSNHKHQEFIQALLKKWKPGARHVEQAVPEGAVVYKKDTEEDASSRSLKSKDSASRKTKEQLEMSKSLEEPPSDSSSQQQAVKDDASPVKPSPSRKTKFVPLFDSEGKDRSVTKIPGRHPCVCQAHKHGLINNCLRCGRVVCKQEGSGPCVFCGNLVCSEEEREIISRGSRKGDKLYESLMKGSAVPKFLPQEPESPQAAKAKEHKDRLIHFDQTSVRRTKVIDDESDYFATDSRWISPEERERLQRKKDAIQSKKHASRRQERTITFDFAGRQLVDSAFDMKELENSLAADAQSFDEDITNIPQHTTSSGLTNPALSEKPQFQQQEDGKVRVKNAAPTISVDKRALLRLQDKGLQEVIDNGMCLSMHQPWASLLVAGIKLHEGRTWYSPHRGRLWIAATAQNPTDIEIKTLEDDYSKRYGSSLSFPDTYPTGCLLGYVNLADVLSQQDYRQQYPDGESTSPYVFICEYPQELPLKFSLKGKHKIYKLNPEIHKSARMGLQGALQVR